jgi:phenylalanyl-tRNA synthetase beta chain
MGIVFNKNREESKCLGFIFSGEKELESIANAGKPQNLDFFEFGQRITNCIGEFELEPMSKITNSFIHPYQNANIIVNDKKIGFISKLHPSVASDFDIEDTFIAQVDFALIDDSLIQATSISKYQSSKRDLSIVVPKDLEYSLIKKQINLLDIKQIKQFNLIDIYSDKTLKDNESLTIKFVLQDDDKTMEENEITEIMNKILTQLKENLNISLRD